jgi:hypothetical protein
MRPIGGRAVWTSVSAGPQAARCASACPSSAIPRFRTGCAPLAHTAPFSSCPAQMENLFTGIVSTLMAHRNGLVSDSNRTRRRTTNSQHAEQGLSSHRASNIQSSRFLAWRKIVATADLKRSPGFAGCNRGSLPPRAGEVDPPPSLLALIPVPLEPAAVDAGDIRPPIAIEIGHRAGRRPQAFVENLAGPFAAG